MKKDFRLSVSQLKKLHKSIALWCGKYILEIDEPYDNLNTIVGNMFHLYIQHNSTETAMKYLAKYHLNDLDRHTVINWFTNLVDHYSYYKDKCPGKHEDEVEYTYLGYPFIAYIDFIADSGLVMKDWKSVHKFTDKHSTYPNHWSGLTTYQEYELQAWQYMIATGIMKVEFVEFLKTADIYERVPKNKQNIFKPGDRKIPPEESHNVITFEWSEEWNDKMADYRDTKIEEAKVLRDKFKPLVKDVD